MNRSEGAKIVAPSPPNNSLNPQLLLNVGLKVLNEKKYASIYLFLMGVEINYVLVSNRDFCCINSTLPEIGLTRMHRSNSMCYYT